MADGSTVRKWGGGGEHSERVGLKGAIVTDWGGEREHSVRLGERGE